MADPRVGAVQRVRGSRPDFFEPFELGGQFPDLGIEFGQLLLVCARLALQILGFGKEMGEMVDGVTLPSMELTRMDGGHVRPQSAQSFFPL